MFFLHKKHTYTIKNANSMLYVYRNISLLIYLFLDGPGRRIGRKGAEAGAHGSPVQLARHQLGRLQAQLIHLVAKRGLAQLSLLDTLKINRGIGG